MQRTLVAGVGNVLRGDDGFGVAVAERLARASLPAGVTVVETGIAGIALVQELQCGWDSLVLVDAVDRGRPPGTVMVIEPEVVDVQQLSWKERNDLIADMHLATPDRVLVLARALGALPAWVRIVGCQPTDAESVKEGLSVVVSAAVDIASAEVLRLLEARAAVANDA